MCLLIVRPKGKSLDKTVYEQAFKANPHGVGMAYVKDDVLVIDKGHMAFDAWYAHFEGLPDTDMLIHFRKASQDMGVTPDMCHPFAADTAGMHEIKVGGEEVARYQFAIAHNGKLAWRNTKECSDTACFVNDVMRPMLNRDPYFFEQSVPGETEKDDPVFYNLDMFESYIKDSNKMVVLRWDRKKKELDTYIVNEFANVMGRRGHYKDGCWFSNESYVKETHPYWPKHEGGRGMYGDGYAGGYGGDYELEAQISYTEYTEALKPDKDGWVWDEDCLEWYNINTKRYEMYVPGLPRWPKGHDFWGKITPTLKRKPNTNGFSTDTSVTPSTAVVVRDTQWKNGKDAEIAVAPTTTTIVPTTSKTVPYMNDGNLNHLKKMDRQCMARIAMMYKGSVFPSLTLDETHILSALRAAVRRRFRETEHMALDELDQWIIKKDLDHQPGDIKWLVESRTGVIKTAGVEVAQGNSN